LHLDQEDGVDISANSLHPGTITTNLFRHNSAVNGKSTTLFYSCEFMFRSRNCMVTFHFNCLLKWNKVAFVYIVLWCYILNLVQEYFFKKVVQYLLGKGWWWNTMRKNWCKIFIWMKEPKHEGHQSLAPQGRNFSV